MRRGDIYLAEFPFGDTAANKLRPVLLLAGPVGASAEVLVAYISSVAPSSLMPTDLLLDPALPEYATTRLRVRSVLRLHKLATLHRIPLQRRLGTVNNKTQQEVDTKLRAFLSL